MPFEDISVIRNKLLAFSFLEGDTAKELEEVWSQSFSSRSALFTAVNSGENEMVIREKVTDRVTPAGFWVNPGDTCCVAVFVDLTKEMKQEDLKQVGIAIDTLANATLQCTNLIVSYVGYAGKATFWDGEKVKANIRLVQAAVAHNHKLWLVAKPAMMAVENYWKPAVAFLDILCRDNLTTGTLSPNGGFINDGCIGVFCYGEYDYARQQKLEKELAQLNRWLGRDGSGEFSTEVSKMFSHLEETARKKFKVDTSMQPIHPDMYPTGFWARHDANHDRGAFALGRTATEAAVNATASNLESQITEFYLNEFDNYKDCLVTLFRSVNVGIDLVTDADKIRGVFVEYMVDDPLQSCPRLCYNPDGYDKPIREYLGWALEHAIKAAEKKTAEHFVKAYESLSAKRIQEEKRTLLDKKAAATVQRNQLPDVNVFVQQVLGNGQGMRQLFNPIIPGGVTSKFLLCRSEADMVWIEQTFGATHTDTRQLFVDAQNDGVAGEDGTPIRGLFARYFSCTDARMDDVLR